jgi:transglutaminase-like putative cysteine protease
MPTSRKARLLERAAATILLSASISNIAIAQNTPARVRLETTQIDVQPDGTATETNHRELQVFTAKAAMQLAQFPISYVESMQDIDITEAYTLKADGRKLAVEASGVLTQQAPQAANAPLFTDIKQKVVVFPNVEVGDTLVLTTKRHDKQAYFKGRFTRQSVFSPLTPVAQYDLTINIPKRLSSTLEAHDIEFEKGSSGDKDVYKAHYENLNPEAEDVAAISSFDRLPRYFISTFKNYDEMGSAYAALFAPKATVTAKIKAQAESITAGITDRREQARAIYEWVNQHVRYVGIELGQGAIVPRDAELVLTNAYGDCKDITVLLSALLKAKNIDSEPVMINAGNGYVLSAAPTLAELNHVIAWLPEFKLYADATAQAVPFGMLPLYEYGKSVVLAGNDTGLRQIPVLAADAGTMTYTSVAKLDDTMRLNDESTTTATGVFAAQLRSTGARIQATGPERVASDLLKRQNRPNATGTFTVTGLGNFAPQFSLASKFSTPRPQNINGMPGGLRIQARTGDFLMGPIGNTKLKDTDPTPCYSGSMSEDISLEIPASRHLAKVPDDSNVKTANLEFTSHWSLSGQTLTVHREFKSTVDQPLCTGEVRKDTAAALTRINQDYSARISLVAN